MTAEQRIAEYKRKIALCDAEEREATNLRTRANALIYGGAGVTVVSIVADQIIGLPLAIVSVIVGFVWRSNLDKRALWRSRRRDAHWAALKNLTCDP
jgi:hypothetical protein